MLYEELDPERYFVCPYRWFMSLALPDEVFVEYNDPAEFDKRWIRTGTNSRQYHIKEDKMELPILRKLEGNKISETEIMSATSIGKYLRQLGERCGYEEPLTYYTFRRGFGNGVEGKCHHELIRATLSITS